MDSFNKKLWCVIGLPLSGKSYAVKLMAAELKDGAVCISTGDIARNLSTKETWTETERNDLFPLEDALRAELKRLIDNATVPNIIIDGFPRFDAQANYLADTFWDYRPEVIEVNAGDQSTLFWRAKNRARDSRDTNEFEFLHRMTTASRNMSGALAVINKRLGRTYTLMSADVQYMRDTIQNIIKRTT